MKSLRVSRTQVAGLVISWVLAMLALGWIYPSPYLSGELMVAPEMLKYRAWWQRPVLVGGLLLVSSTVAYLLVLRLARGRAILAVGSVILLLVPLRYGHRWLIRHNPQEFQSCANCRSFIWSILEQYYGAHDGWLPRGGKDEWDSLAKAIRDENDVHHFTSHALTRKAEAYWKETKSLNDEVCCYRYNEGLRWDDPKTLILMYFESPGYWECTHHRKEELGRVCRLLDPNESQHRWPFLAEKEFQEAQKRTEQFLEPRIKRSKDIERVQADLKLVVAHTVPTPGIYRFTCRLENVAQEQVRVQTPPTVGVLLGERGGWPTWTQARSVAEEILVCPASVFPVKCYYDWNGTDTAPRNLESPEGKAARWIQLSMHVRVSREGIADLDMALVSEKYRYLLVPPASLTP